MASRAFATLFSEEIKPGFEVESEDIGVFSDSGFLELVYDRVEMAFFDHFEFGFVFASPVEEF